jgi:CRP/FNR family transcriptional regulator, cyclic AMP receptor protein
VSALPAAASAVTSTAATGSRSTIALLSVDHGLREAVPAAELQLAERVLIVPRWELEQGPWSPETLVDEGARPFAALLLRGLVSHEIVLAGRRSANLLGPGDLFRPWRGVDTALPCTSSWTAAPGATIAVLDARFVTATRRWAGLAAVVHERLAEQLDVATVRAAIVGLPRVEERVLALFWQLADRWGVVRPEGVVVQLPLTHALIGQLVGAQRPTVSLALQSLADDGLLLRGDIGAWTLDHESRATLAPREESRFGRGAPASARRRARDAPALNADSPLVAG